MQPHSRFRILVLISVDELIKCTLCIDSSLGHPDLVQRLFRFQLCRLRKRIQFYKSIDDELLSPEGVSAFSSELVGNELIAT